MIDQTFGFDTACTEATKAVNSAYVEAKGNATEAALSWCLIQPGLGGPGVTVTNHNRMGVELC